MTAVLRWLSPRVGGCLLLAGCATYVNYPAEWNPLDTSSADCSTVTGEYENWGTRVTWSNPGVRQWTRESVPLHAAFEKEAFPAGAERMLVAVGKDGTMDVTAIYESKPPVNARYLAAKDEFQCESGRIRLAATSSGGVGGLGVGVSRDLVTLGVAGDGALVVERSGMVAGVALLVPFAMMVRDWARFERHAPDKRERRPAGAPEGPPATPGEDFVNCVSGGERRWTHRSRCD